ncbi:Gfo/Idh/MocA family protein [Gracilibacillus salinarum]|uniref:Gfo/Idh/MocA family oxidoreductase n=1 Tax=Gracilibacillus salinarum TaxID=2932255 RepID=A0ABY4GME9_9BACI|nr:Gfo/Idh/MocA family oxidoreductase [Gracilibacillus salinarum]UOQ85130.1 Gfo/Idh/MocA family oxidoreductase [Gracilibacillus salinarum]
MANIWLDDAQARANAEIVALVDLDRKAAEQKVKERNLEVPVYTDLSLAIQETKATLVFDVTIPAAHKQVVSTALQSGCHVFGEKPMAESLTDADAIIQLTEATGKQYSVMQNRRYLKEIRTLQHLIDQQQLGDIHTLNVDFYLAPHFGGFREQMDHPLLVDMAIHTFDQARFLSQSNAVSVYCHAYNPTESWYEGKAAAVCIFEMENGAVFTYRGSWAAEGLRTSWNGDWRVIGTRGTATWDGFEQLEMETVQDANASSFFRDVQRQQVSNTWNGREQHHGCLDEMFTALESNRKAETDCHDNIHSLRMVFAAIESAKTNKKVYL